MDERFAASRALFESTLGFLDGAQAASLEHAELETQLEVRPAELVRQLMQDHLELRAQREQRLQEVIDAEQVARGSRRDRAHPRADHGVRRGDGDQTGLPPPRSRQPVSRRRGS